MKNPKKKFKLFLVSILETFWVVYASYTDNVLLA